MNFWGARLTYPQAEDAEFLPREASLTIARSVCVKNGGKRDANSSFRRAVSRSRTVAWYRLLDPVKINLGWLPQIPRAGDEIRTSVRSEISGPRSYGPLARSQTVAVPGSLRPPPSFGWQSLLWLS